jgi:hypothetical protein
MRADPETQALSLLVEAEVQRAPSTTLPDEFGLSPSCSPLISKSFPRNKEIASKGEGCPIGIGDPPRSTAAFSPPHAACCASRLSRWGLPAKIVAVARDHGLAILAASRRRKRGAACELQ